MKLSRLTIILPLLALAACGETGFLNKPVVTKATAPDGTKVVAAPSPSAARAIGRAAPGARAPLYLGAAALGAVQVPRGSHFAADVVAGAVVGLVSEALVDAAFEAFVPGRDHR